MMNTQEHRSKVKEFSDYPHIGQLLLKFKLPGKGFIVAMATGILIKRLNKYSYLLLTCAHVFKQYLEDDDEPLVLKEGQFLLNRKS